MHAFLEKSGKIIKKIAVVIFYGGLVLAVIGGFFVGREVGLYGYVGFHFLRFLFSVIVGAISTTVSSIFIYAFGDLVDNVKTIAHNSHSSGFGNNFGVGSSS